MAGSLKADPTRSTAVQGGQLPPGDSTQAEQTTALIADLLNVASLPEIREKESLLGVRYAAEKVPDSDPACYRWTVEIPREHFHKKVGKPPLVYDHQEWVDTTKYIGAKKTGRNKTVQYTKSELDGQLKSYWYNRPSSQPLTKASNWCVNQGLDRSTISAPSFVEDKPFFTLSFEVEQGRLPPGEKLDPVKLVELAPQLIESSKGIAAVSGDGWDHHPNGVQLGVAAPSPAAHQSEEEPEARIQGTPPEFIRGQIEQLLEKEELKPEVRARLEADLRALKEAGVGLPVEEEEPRSSDGPPPEFIAAQLQNLIESGVLDKDLKEQYTAELQQLKQQIKLAEAMKKRPVLAFYSPNGQ